MSKILFNDNSNEATNQPDTKIDQSSVPNIFQGRAEAEKSNANFPDWDIVPPSQFINPRLKPQ